MAHEVTLIPGDGIGPEVAAAARQVLKAIGVNINWHVVDAQPIAERRGGQFLHVEMLDSVRQTKVALKGPITTPIAEGHRSINVALRQALELYANLRPVKNLPGVKTRFENVDLVIIRENTEDLYSGLEHTIVPGVVESLKIITEKASTRIARFAFEYARSEKRSKVTAIHKANIMKLSDGLFLSSIRKVAQENPDIEYNEVIVDNLCMQLVMKPHKFDILLLENLYGDIVSDLAAGLVGGLGVVPGANLGEEYAVFEAVHGSAPDIAGQNKANPTAILLSSVLMLQYLGERAAADRIERAIHKTYQEGKTLTADVGGSASTTEFTEALLQAL